ncbi:MAG: glycosyltransferase [Bacteroidetes bacterium]|nr:glycosyltransferase [Bacteroidota bacterium]
MTQSKTPHILIIGSVWPEPDSSAAGSRMLQLIELFQSQEWDVTFASVAADSEFAIDLEKINVKKVRIELNSDSFDSFVKELNPSIVMFDRFMTEEQFGWRVAENCPDALRILDTEDLHSLRRGRHLAWKENRPFSPEDLYSDVAKREIASIYRCDLSLIISEYEMKLLKDNFKIDVSLLHYLPFMLESVHEYEHPSFSQRKNFISIGNFLHEPNWDSVVYLKNEIWPRIRKKLPDVELHVYGAYPSQKVFELNNAKEGFIIKGRTEKLWDVMINSRVLLAPLRFGAGLKGKLIDAMTYGTPNVTTPLGAESMHGDLEWCGLIADNAQDFADSAVKLYSDEKLWKQSQQNGIKIINTLFQKKEAGEKLISNIQKLSHELQSHRMKNFTGAMLMHHTIASTKYMSKWIEEKNK